MKNIDNEKIHFDAPSSISITYENNPENFPPHWHTAAEFTIALEDGSNYKINDISYQLQKGDVLLVWPQQIHETITSPSGSVLFIQFPSTIIENNLDLVSISRFLYDCHHISNTKEPELSKYISEQIIEIKKIHNSSDPLSETKCKLCIYNILLKIGEYVLTKSQNDSVIDKGLENTWKYIHSACNYILENSAENITQSDVAKHIGISTFYFSKLFKQHMHMSFPTYLANIRVKSAASLLLDASLSITECAFQAGFQSTTAFNKTFHDVTGYSPRDYRKLYK